MKTIAWILGIAAAGMAAPPQEADRKDRLPAVPGPEHEALRAFEGAWDAEIRHCAEHGGSETASGSETGAMRLGGFWLMSEFRSTKGGKPFQGHSMIGYDPGRKRYVMTWTASTSGHLVLFEGDYDRAARTFTMTADAVGPGGRPFKLQAIHRIVDPDHTEFRLVGLGLGREGRDCPCMTIQYTKRC